MPWEAPVIMAVLSAMISPKGAGLPTRRLIWRRHDFSIRRNYLECLLHPCKNPDMADLDDIAVFVRVAQSESFSRAAHALGMPVSTVSRKVTALEEGSP